MTNHSTDGFTLMEVLIALVIIAIALTALMKSSNESIILTNRLKEETIRHWVAEQAINSIQLGLVPIHLNQELSEQTLLFHQKWYWKAMIKSTSIKRIERIEIRTSPTVEGPFTKVYYGFRYFTP